MEAIEVVKYPTFEFVEKQLRKKDFCIFSSVSPKGRSHSTGIIYGVSPPGTDFAFYILTGDYSRKARNVKDNPNVSVVVPFPHYYLRMVPQWVVQFQGKGEIVPFEDPGAQETFHQKSSLRGSLKDAEGREGIVFIKIKPDKKIHCYGLGISLRAIRKDYAVASYSVTVPS